MGQVSSVSTLENSQPARVKRDGTVWARLRNVLQDGQVCATGGRYKHVRGEATLRAAVEAANWGAPKSGPYVGRGISLGQRPQGQSVYSVTVSMDEHARATFYTLVPETGT